jgi:Holliday junction resolvase
MAEGRRRGIDRERRVAEQLLLEGWFVVRAAGSLGFCDLIALKAGHDPLLVEVKSTRQGPYERFPPADREDLVATAKIAGAEAWLCWWPSHGKPQWIHSSQWPAKLRAVK